MDTPSSNAGRDREPDPEGDRRRIDELDERLKKARGPAKDEPRLDLRVSHRQTGVAYRVMVDMIAGLLVGGFLGYGLDRWMGWAPYSLVVGLLLGFAAGVNNAWRAIRAYSEEAARGNGNSLP
ncbi:MAG: AtpZ/AtpI family protein [Alphaproteobacteria bacterium]|jgi:ATP synthase protein I|nr:AtpZ/AtpI family protein [Alphaproteobacteria bacterium]